jgi:hypothetical protein
MPDLKLRDEMNARTQRQQHRKAIRSAVPLDFEGQMSSDTQICARGQRFSAAC